jgi:thiosulfate reductase cytochrome b subunit
MRDATPALDPVKKGFRPRVIQPGWVRVTHWLNVVAVLVMVTSGWQVYDASPLFSWLVVPDSITLGGWLGGALLWHFAGMWLLVGNFLVYLIMNLATGRLFKKMLPVTPMGVIRDLWAALRGVLKHDDLSHYNAVQRLAYLAVIVDLIVLIASGLAIWKSVQFPLLRSLMGGYDSARFVHFFAMSFMVLFFFVHVAMVAVVPRSLLVMIRGR